MMSFQNITFSLNIGQLGSGIFIHQLECQTKASKTFHQTCKKKKNTLTNSFENKVLVDNFLIFSIMTHTFHIDTTSAEAKALVDYLRTLDFISEEKGSSYKLTEKQIQTVEEARSNYISGKDKGIPWEDLKKELNNK